MSLRPLKPINCKYERWTICDKETGFQKTTLTLGWYKIGTSKKEVLQHAKNNGIIIKEDEDIAIAEEQ